MSRCSRGPRDSSPQCSVLSEWSHTEHSETSVFTAATFDRITRHAFQDIEGKRQAHDFLQVWSSFFWWFSGEVKHFVHLIRWNLEGCYMPIGARTWPRSRCSGIIARHSRKLGTESCFNFLWFHQLIPIGPLSHAFFPPQVGWLRRVLRCL